MTGSGRFPQVAYFAPPALLPEGQVLALNFEQCLAHCTVSLLSQESDSPVVAQGFLSRNGIRALERVLAAYPAYCSSTSLMELLYPQRLGMCQVKRDISMSPLWDMMQYVAREVSRYGIKPLPVVNHGYTLVPLKQVVPAAGMVSWEIPSLFCPGQVLVLYPELGLVSLLDRYSRAPIVQQVRMSRHAMCLLLCTLNSYPHPCLHDQFLSQLYPAMPLGDTDGKRDAKTIKMMRAPLYNARDQISRDLARFGLDIVMVRHCGYQLRKLGSPERHAGVSIGNFPGADGTSARPAQGHQPVYAS